MELRIRHVQAGEFRHHYELLIAGTLDVLVYEVVEGERERNYWRSCGYEPREPPHPYDLKVKVQIKCRKEVVDQVASLWFIRRNPRNLNPQPDFTNPAVYTFVLEFLDVEAHYPETLRSKMVYRQLVEHIG